jgi:hypothetical protein
MAGAWVSALFGWPRNNYDEPGRFAQGFVPAILTREILLRTSPLQDRGAGRPSPWHDRSPARLPAVGALTPGAPRAPEAKPLRHPLSAALLAGRCFLCSAS